MGAVGRALIDTLRAADIPYTTVVSSDTGSRRGAHFARGRDKAVYDVTIACINADEMPYAADRLGEDLHVGGPVAGIWAWEVEHFPPWMAASEALVDEVWTYSEHSAEAIRAAVSCPVAVFPPPIADAEPIPLTRADLHLPDGYLFLFCFDAHSVFERKNPAGGGPGVPGRLPARRGPAARGEGGQRRPARTRPRASCDVPPPTGPTSRSAPTASRPSARWR